MIELDRVVARIPPVVLASLTVHLEGGVHALLGGNGDGPSIVLAVLAGQVRVRSGSARVLGSAAGDAQVRRAIAYVPLDAVLPGPLRVDEVLATAARIRGEPAGDPALRLEPFGIGALARRPVHTLARDEVRAVALVEAVTSGAKLILVEEPLASIDSRALGALAEALRARARDGGCVVVATGSARDARALADDVLTFDRGTLVRRAPATDPLVLAGPRGACVRVLVSGVDGVALGTDAKRLAAALAAEQTVREVTIAGGLLVAVGADVATVAAVVARCALREGIPLEMLRPDVLRDEELRASISGDAAGAYRAAYERALGPAPVARRPEEEPA